MRTWTRSLIVLATTMLGCAAQAASPPLPAAVQASVKSAADMCSEVGGKADTSNAVTRVDLTGDGVEDYVISVGAINCVGAASIYGDRQKGVQVMVGDGKGGAKDAFGDYAYDVAVEGTGPAAKVWLDVAAESCGKKPAKDFASENFCSRSLVWNPKTQKFDYAPVSTVRMIQ
jgi:hypothetical protein